MKQFSNILVSAEKVRAFNIKDVLELIGPLIAASCPEGLL